MRRIVLPLLILTLLLAMPTSALAGGAWLEPDRRVYVSADSAPRSSSPSSTATMRGTFSRVAGNEGRPADGPWFAYLLPEDRWIHNDRIPPIAIPLGELRVLGASDGPGATAVVSFHVPDLPTGWYHVGYCNDPCTLNGMGDLIGSKRFVIAPSRLEGAAFIWNDRLQRARSSASERVAGWRDRVTALERVNEGLERINAEQARFLEGAQSRISGLQAELELVSAAAAADRATPREMDTTLWIAGLALVLGAAGGILAARRRRGFRVVVPDTVPDDLEELTGAARRSSLSR